MNFEKPGSPPSKREQDAEQHGINQDVLRNIVRDMFFDAVAPTTISDLATRIAAKANEYGLASDKLEREFMAYMSDELANSVD